MKNAIQKAIEGGFDLKGYLPEWEKHNFMMTDTTSEMLLDPLFWQCLGKGLGWREEVEIFMGDDQNDHPFMGGSIDYPYSEGAGMTYKVASYKYHWHQFIDHIADGGDVDEYFTNLTHLK